MESVRELLFFCEFIVVGFIIFLVLIQGSAESEPMISSRSENFDKVDKLVLSVTKFLIFIFFLNTLAILSINKKISIQKKTSLEKAMKKNASIFDVK